MMRLRRSAVRRLAAWGIHSFLFAKYRRAIRAYRKEIGRLPDVAFPSSYNEKMYWRMFFDHNPTFVTYCDKLRAKDLFSAFADCVQVPETLWIGEDPEQIPEDLWAPDVVVKMNAGASRNWFMATRPDDREAFNSTCRRWLLRPYGVRGGEWAYGKVRPLLFAERTIARAGQAIQDLKVHLFGGNVFYTLIYIAEKTPRSLSAIFDEDGRRLSVTNSIVVKDPSRALPADYRVPECYATAMRVARAIAERSDYLRVDFMVAGDQLYSGEVTVYPTAGLMTNSEPAVLAQMGRSWDLRDSWFLSTPQCGWRARYQDLLRAHVEG
jgi:hypothetical protein